MKTVVQTFVSGGLEVRVYNDGSVRSVQRQGQWVFVLDGGTYMAFNPDPSFSLDPFDDASCAACPHRFYDMVPGIYGEPLVHQEPSLGLPVPTTLVCVDAHNQPAQPDPRMRIHGIVCCDTGNPTPVYRGSWSNLVKMGVAYAVQSDGTVIVNGETWYIHALANADKGRILGYFIVAGRAPVARVQLRELGDLAHLCLQ